MADAPTVTDWISAISTSALGVAGALITAFQWRMSGFKPRITSRVDARHEAIELAVVNRGRAAGIVDQIDVLDPDGSLVEDVTFEGFTAGAFRPVSLPGAASMRVIVQAPEGGRFRPGVRLLVGLGAEQPQTCTPRVVPEGVGIFGLRSVLPPGTPT